MKIAFFGGTFDPVHFGHLAIARAAADRFHLHRVYFAPADIPPHKRKRTITAFPHRLAMLALATDGEERFVPSLLDAHTGQPNYSIDTVRRLKRSLTSRDKLYFLIGMDAFQDIRAWRKPVELLAECEFIVASRPGYSLEDVGRALPAGLRPPEPSLRELNQAGRSRKLALPGATIHLLDDVHETMSSTQIRAGARKSTQELSRFVPWSVAEYIRKQHLYGLSASLKRGSAAHGKMLSLHRGAARSRRYE